MLAGCQPGSPEPAPPTAPGPGPAPEISGGSLHFTAQGDIGVKKSSKQVLDTIAGLRPQLNLALGDFSYKAGIEQQFCDMVKGKLGPGFPYQVIAGNHDSDGTDGDIDTITKCLPNKLPGLQGDYGTQWYVDVPEKNPLVRLIMVSPGIPFEDGQDLDYSSGSDRLDWTTKAIDGAAAANIPWTILGMHATCLSVGRYDCPVGHEFANMLLAKKVDLVLTGHDHIYQRTHQLALGPDCPALVPDTFSPGCIADFDDTLVKTAGTVFTTTGVGGESLYDVHKDDSEAKYFAAFSGKNRSPAFGTLDVVLTADKLSARFVPADGYTFTDAFSIARQ